MNIYRYQNCVIFNLWNYHLPWADEYTEIQMHGLCIYNVITRQIRLWNKEHWINDKHFPLKEIENISEKTKLHIIDVIEHRAEVNSCPLNPTGVFDMNEDNGYYDFIFNNYIGNFLATQVKLKNQIELKNQFLSNNRNPNIIKDPYYMMRFNKK